MKKFLTAVGCCALMAMNVSGQELASPSEVQSVIVATDSEAAFASTVQESTVVTPTPEVEAPAAVVEEQAAVEAPAVVVEESAVVAVEQTFVAAAPVADCGCGQATSVMNYDAGVSYAPVAAAPVADCGCAPAPVADCGCEPAPADDCCCEAGRQRVGLLARLRARRTCCPDPCCN